jgi:hypothetical protein
VSLRLLSSRLYALLLLDHHLTLNIIQEPPLGTEDTVMAVGFLYRPAAMGVVVGLSWVGPAVTKKRRPFFFPPTVVAIQEDYLYLKNRQSRASSVMGFSPLI